MKKRILFAALAMATHLSFAQGDSTKTSNNSIKSESTATLTKKVSIEGVYGISEIYGANNGNAVGLGLGLWLPVKKFYIDLSADFAMSSSRNNLSLHGMFLFPFDLLKDENVIVSAYAGGGLALGRIFNDQDFFQGPVEDYGLGGLLANVGLNFQPASAQYMIYLDLKAGIVSVPDWSESVRAPFTLSVGGRFDLK